MNQKPQPDLTQAAGRPPARVLAASSRPSCCWAGLRWAHRATARIGGSDVVYGCGTPMPWPRSPTRPLRPRPVPARERRCRACTWRWCNSPSTTRSTRSSAGTSRTSPGLPAAPTWASHRHGGGHGRPRRADGARSPSRAGAAAVRCVAGFPFRYAETLATIPDGAAKDAGIAAEQQQPARCWPPTTATAASWPTAFTVGRPAPVSGGRPAGSTTRPPG